MTATDRTSISGTREKRTTEANGPGAVKGARGAPDTSLKARQQALVPLPSETHGGEDVALYATGPGSAEVHGVLEQNRIGRIVRRALGLD